MAVAPLMLQGLSAALRLLRWARRSKQGCVDQFGAGQGWSIPERSVGTTWKPRAPRQRREDCPAAAEVLRPAPPHQKAQMDLAFTSSLKINGSQHSHKRDTVTHQKCNHSRVTLASDCRQCALLADRIPLQQPLLANSHNAIQQGQPC